MSDPSGIDVTSVTAWLDAHIAGAHGPYTFDLIAGGHSNLTFGGIQQATAVGLGLKQTTVLALQSAGGAMGNMVCIHNIVAVCSILGLQDEEGTILRKTFLPTLLYGAIAGIVSLML